MYECQFPNAIWFKINFIISQEYKNHIRSQLWSFIINRYPQLVNYVINKAVQVLTLLKETVVIINVLTRVIVMVRYLPLLGEGIGIPNLQKIK